MGTSKTPFPARYPETVRALRQLSRVACGENLKQDPEIVATNIAGLVEQSRVVHKDRSRAARALGVNASTFYRWIARGRFGIAAAVLIFGMAGGAYLGTSTVGDGEPRANHPSVSAAAASVAAPALAATATTDDGASARTSEDTSAGNGSDAPSVQVESARSGARTPRRSRGEVRGHVTLRPGPDEGPVPPAQDARFVGGSYSVDDELSGFRFVGGSRTSVTERLSTDTHEAEEP